MSTTQNVVQVSAVFNVNNTAYNTSMNIPTTSPSASNPFLFTITSEPTGSASSTTSTTSTPATPTNILTVAVGGSGLVYVSVEPPNDLITNAFGSDVVQNLSVALAEGTYDATSNSFSSSSAST
ncbi:hypothetical protein [Azospirillum rugosum]|uniref:Uncharacterized protein n=1 Tax=Azospirillum rugosum TaxID=416170 RepID=A0ABS4SR20_9PROT|nr:hypothetical protein [Azospirillum rugosum]MBP2294995.1 hypothetical protein [Azospirillum rugosum]MDQ0528818.1 hypothetical protein [Azospirillum rugosum]